MHDKPNLGPEQADAAILGLLLEPDSQRPWSADEVARELGDELAAIDSLARLAGAGLVYRLDRFVWVSRAAALHSDRLAAVA
ncbi:MAG: hypothetical protein FVQ82_17520 [Planctomycetes bacterium]|nr:hypothetical protein [Planctomycetota bacterium]